MENTQEFYDAQDLSPWIDSVNLLTCAEARAERQYHLFLVSLNRPKPSAMAIALARVLAIPSVNARIGK